MSSEDGLPSALVERIRDVTGVMLERLADDKVLAEAVRQSKAASTRSLEWGGPGLYGGHAGMALVFKYAASALPGDAARWRGLSRRFIREAARRTQEQPVPFPCLGIGTSGLALAVEQLSADDPALRPALGRLRDLLAQQVAQGLSRRGADGVSPDAYDVISGASGVLGYLASLPEPSAEEREAVGMLLDDLVWMCDPGGGTARWHVPPRFMFGQELAKEHPHGYVDLGMSHGLAGPLAAMSQAWSRGHRRPGLRPAMEHVAAFLLEMSDEDEYGRCWPRMVSLTPSGTIRRTPPSPGHESWCYGAPGICSALLDAATALGDGTLRTAATEGFEAALRRVAAGHGHLVNASLCHGWSGLLAVCGRFAREDGGAAARAAIPHLAEQVLDACDPAHPLLVKEFQPPDIYMDSPDLLDGAAGIPLALWTAAGLIDDRWQRALLIH
ncbi:MAG TPA: lanthionine synthetase C family protein [Nonomuraea sp.]|nr:lanthionine synthetase C family protein [Nonomuraea sp.]